MNIVILDAQTLKGDELEFHCLKKYGPLLEYDRTPPDQILSRAKNADILITNKTPISKEVIEQCPKLKLITILATGYNVVDTNAAKEKKIPVCNVPGYSGMSVAQHTFALLLELTNKIYEHHQAVVQNNEWVDCPDFCFTKGSLTELDQLNFGIIGYGDIAKKTIAIAQAFGMKILVNTRTIPQNPPKGINFVDKAELFKRADVISLNCPLTDDTKHIINQKSLALMKSSTLIINTGRGPLINEADLAQALAQNKIAGAALDVLSTEPPLADNPLLKAPNCIITPHIAWATLSARTRLLHETEKNIKAFLQGKPTNVVNP